MLALPVIGQGNTINVEIDYMVDAMFDHEPDAAVIAAVEQMFACHGITLNLVVDDAIPLITVMSCTPVKPDDFFTCTEPGSFASLKATWFDNTGQGWHYAIFGHQYDTGKGTTSSGIGEIDGDDFLVSLGSFDAGIGTLFDQAATLAHELGHNLGLEHAWVDAPAGIGDYQVNYASIMSYQYQLAGVRSRMECVGLVDANALFKDLDYSNGWFPSLSEVALSEAIGLGVQSIDWNCSGTIGSGMFAAELDTDFNWCGATLNVEPFHRDQDDWSLIATSLAPGPKGPREPRVVTCMTAEQRAAQFALAPNPNLCVNVAQPTLATEDCLFGADMNWVDPAAAGRTPSGNGDSPYPSLSLAAASVVPGSVLYLQPGTYSSEAPQIVITKRMVLASPTGAVVSP